MSPRALPALWMVVAAVLSLGCSEDPPAAPPENPPAEPAGYTDAAALLTAHARALTKQDYALYQKLLHEDFEYFPLTEDLVDFAWLLETRWYRTDELQMIGNMFEDHFQPAEDGSGPPVNTVDVIDARMTAIGARTESDGSMAVDVAAVILVLCIDGNATRSDVRFEFRLVGGADGYLRIRSIEEKPPSLRAVPDFYETSWAAMKNSYR